MAELQIGQKVTVDMSGFQATGVKVANGFKLPGKIVTIDAISKEITVKLVEPFMGRPSVIVDPGRVTVI